MQERGYPAGKTSDLALAIIRSWRRFDPQLTWESPLGQAIDDLVRANQQGSTCIAVEENWLSATSPLVQQVSVFAVTCPTEAPLFCVDQRYLYFARWWQIECRIAREIKRLMGVSYRSGHPFWTALEGVAAAEKNACLQKLFPFEDPHHPSMAYLATASLLNHKIIVINGGPGTGKTTLVAKMLLFLQLLWRKSAVKEPLRVALAAPTGKAAGRLLEAIQQQRAAGFSEPLGTEDFSSLWEEIPTQASTLHRLLGSSTPASLEPSFFYGEKRRLPLDVLVVDEASMIDLKLAQQLLIALPDGCRLLMLGDSNQLPSVETGSFFTEIATAFPCLSERVPVSAPAESAAVLVPLTKNYRFHQDSGIGALATAISQGDVTAAQKILTTTDYADVAWFPAEAAEDLVLTGYQAYFSLVKTLTASLPVDATELTDVSEHLSNQLSNLHQALQEFQVLSPFRQGREGTDFWNRYVDQQARMVLAKSMAVNPRQSWYLGRPILVEQNDSRLGLSNGDVGIVWQASLRDKPAVYFPLNTGKWRKIVPEQLPFHRDAYALTVHKAQGSEYATVLLLLPQDSVTNYPGGLSRALLYTAVTRAKKKVMMIGSEEIFVKATLNEERRLSGLARLLR